MSRFVNRTATDEITLGNGDKVRVRQRLTAAETADLNRNLVHLRFDYATKEVAMTEGDWHRQRIEVARAYIVSWDFRDDDGKLVAYEPSLVDNLDDETISEITQAIDEMQTTHQEVFAKNA